MSQEVEVQFRAAEVEDASKILDFYQMVGKETDFLEFDGQGVGLNLEAQESYLASVKESPNNLIHLALDGENLLGLVTVAGRPYAKTAHIGELGIIVKKDYWGLGIAQYLLEDALYWAQDSQVIERLVLGVRADNIRAQKAYQKFGFIEEARLTERVKLADRYEDEIIMSLEV